jgi:transcriptional regulator GlxA family with amidase domain
MPNWKITQAGTQKIGVLLFSRFSNHCLASAVEPLRAANMLSRRTLFAWTFLSPGGGPVTASSGLTVTPDAAFGAEGSGDLLFVMPSYDHLAHASAATSRALRSAARRYPVLAGFDTGPWLLAEAGLLDGYRATIHGEELAAFAERFPDVRTERARFLADRDRLTCSGATAAFDLVLDLIGTRHGEALAHEVTALLNAGDAGVPRRPAARYSRLVSRALALMQDNLEDPLPIPALAAALGRPQRDLEARMAAELGAGPARVYRRQRLAYARKLAEESALSVAEIAVRSGYGDPAAMTRAFRAEFGLTPSAARIGVR